MSRRRERVVHARAGVLEAARDLIEGRFAMVAPQSTALNEYQQHGLTATCQHINRLLSDLERAFAEAQSNSPFGLYVNDLAPAEQRLVQDYIARLRTQLVRMLAGQGLSPTPHRVGVRHAILTHLAYVDVAVEELRPHYMRGYGTVAPDAAAALNGIVEELRGTIGQLTRYLAVDRTEDLRARLDRMGTIADLGLLGTLETLITKYGLVEFRSALATILDTLDRRGLELAVFGRVSTGKSSLLNRLLRVDVLPVGVTPITAVPTRIVFGREPRLHVSFAAAAPRALDVAALAEYASERENPANVKRVLRLVVELPAPFLESGVTLVDTPGLGSLATAGAAETLAYLPHCDVAAVLVDANSTITSEDLTTIASLLDAGVRVSVLISKADLLSAPDLETATRYAQHMLAREFAAPISVVAVSVKPEFDGLFQQWREAELAPLIANQERERKTAAGRKTEILRSHVHVTLQRRLSATQQTSGQHRTSDTQAADTVLQTAAGAITALERRLSNVDLHLSRRAPDVITRAVQLADGTRDLPVALGQAFGAIAGEAAADIRNELQGLVRSLREASQRVSSSLQWAGDGNEVPDGHVRFREVPVPALPPDMTLPTPGAERLLGHAIRSSILARRLEHAVGNTVRATLESYASVLRRWALDNLNEIRREWAATTDAIRAEIDRHLGHSQGTSANVEEIETDLRRLAGRPAHEAPPREMVVEERAGD